MSQTTISDEAEFFKQKAEKAEQYLLKVRAENGRLLSQNKCALKANRDAADVLSLLWDALQSGQVFDSDQVAAKIGGVVNILNAASRESKSEATF